MPYGQDPSVVPSVVPAPEPDRRGLRWRGAGPSPSQPPPASAPPPASDVPRDHTPYPELDEDAPGTVVLTLGWLEQVLQLSFGEDVDVRVAGVGKQWRVKLDNQQIVDIVSSLAHYVRAAMPNGGVLTMHAMPLEVREGEGTARLGVDAGKYVFLGISHTERESSGANDSGVRVHERPARARVGLDTCIRLVGGLGGTVSVDRRRSGMTAMNIYLPAKD